MATKEKRLAKIDQFYREWATTHNEEYLGYEEWDGFVIYTTRETDGSLHLRCDNSHLHKEYVSDVKVLDAISLKDSRVPYEMLQWEKEKLVGRCKEAWQKEAGDGR